MLRLAKMGSQFTDLNCSKYVIRQFLKTNQIWMEDSSEFLEWF